MLSDGVALMAQKFDVDVFTTWLYFGTKWMTDRRLRSKMTLSNESLMTGFGYAPPAFYIFLVYQPPQGRRVRGDQTSFFFPDFCRFELPSGTVSVRKPFGRLTLRSRSSRGKGNKRSHPITHTHTHTREKAKKTNRDRSCLSLKRAAWVGTWAVARRGLARKRRGDESMAFGIRRSAVNLNRPSSGGRCWRVPTPLVRGDVGARWLGERTERAPDG